MTRALEILSKQLAALRHECEQYNAATTERLTIILHRLEELRTLNLAMGRILSTWRPTELSELGARLIRRYTWPHLFQKMAVEGFITPEDIPVDQRADKVAQWMQTKHTQAEIRQTLLS